MSFAERDLPLLERARTEAKKDRRSLSYYICRAIEEKLQRDEAAHMALDAQVNEGGGKYTTAEERRAAARSAELLAKSLRALNEAGVPEAERAKHAKLFIDELAQRAPSSTGKGKSLVGRIEHGIVEGVHKRRTPPT